MRRRLFSVIGLAVPLTVMGAQLPARPPVLASAGQVSVSAEQKMESSVPVNDPRIVLIGRFDATNPRAPRLGYPGSGLMLRFRGASLTLNMDSDSATAALTLALDHGAPFLFLLKKGSNRIPVVAASTMWDSSTVAHTLTVYKRTETWQGVVTLHDVQPGDSTVLEAPVLPSRRLMFLGDSVTCGAGVNNTPACKNGPDDPANDAYNSYGVILGRRLDAQVQLVCYGGRGLVRDYRGLSIRDGVLNGPQFLDLSIPADDVSARRPWDHALYSPDAIVVSLGTNDFNLQASQPLDGVSFVGDYAALLRKIRAEYPRALVLATEGAIVTNPLLRAYIQRAVAQVHDSRTVWMAARHYPGNGCDGHPTREQHGYMADDIERVLRQQLGW